MIKQGEIVTIALDDQNNDSSNTFLVFRKLEEESLLSHPLAPGLLVLRKDVELNQVLAHIKNSTERSLEYAVRFQKYLDYDTTAEVEALCMFFVVNRKLTSRQKHALSVICGKIAAIYCNKDISLAIRMVNENRALLDDYNKIWYSNFEKQFTGQKQVSTLGQQTSIFNMCGFVLAQIEG